MDVTQIKPMMTVLTQQALMQMKMQNGAGNTLKGAVSVKWSKIIGGKRVNISWSRTANVVSVETYSTQAALRASFTYHLAKGKLLSYHGAAGTYQVNSAGIKHVDAPI